MDDKPPSPGHESDDTSREYKSITELIRAEFDDEQINGSKKLTRQEKIRQVEALINRPDVTKESFAHLDIKKIQKKIDWRLIPMLTLLYLLSNLDRGNIGNAKIEGLTEDLNMTGNDYNIALTVFFFTYAAFEVPSNMLLKKFRPSIWLPTIMVAWGLVMTLMGVVQSYHGLLVARIFLGVTEAGLFPGVIFYNTMWYTRYEVQVRQAYFFSAASVAGAFSGLLAYAISFMAGVGGLNGWRWIFILEGLLTLAVAFAAYFLIYDFPETANFLTLSERAFIAFRLKYDGQEDHRTTAPTPRVPQNESQTWSAAKAAFTDWTIYLNVIVFWGYVCPLISLQLFLPTIILQLGFPTTTSQLLTIPPYIVAAAFTVVVAYSADKNRVRSPYILTLMCFQLLGFALTLSARGSFGQTYAGVFLAITCIFPVHPTNLTWLSNNQAGSYKRAVAVALQLTLGNLAGAAASNFYKERDGPEYFQGHGVNMGFIVVGMVAAGGLVMWYRGENRRREKMIAEGGLERFTVEELSELGDKAVTFRYTL